MKNFDDLKNKFNLTEIDSIDDNSLIVVYNDDILKYIKASVLKNYLGTTPSGPEASGELSVTFTADNTVNIGGYTYYRANCPGLYNLASRFDYQVTSSGNVYIGHVKIGDDTGHTNLMATPSAEGSKPAMMGPYIAMGEGESTVLMSCLIYGSEWTTGTESLPEGKRDDIFIYPGEYQVSVPFTITFSIEPFADSGSEGSGQFDGKTIKITTDNQTTWEDTGTTALAYYTVIPGVFDALKDKETGNNITIKVTDEGGSSDTFPKSGYTAYFQKPSTGIPNISVLAGPSSGAGGYFYTYNISIMSGTEDDSKYPAEIIKKDTVVLIYSMKAEGKEYVEPAARTGYPKTFELTFN